MHIEMPVYKLLLRCELYQTRAGFARFHNVVRYFDAPPGRNCAPAGLPLPSYYAPGTAKNGPSGSLSKMFAFGTIGVEGWEVFSRGDDVAEESVMEGKPPNPLSSGVSPAYLECIHRLTALLRLDSEMPLMVWAMTGGYAWLRLSC
jgi:hypothetical protein